MAKLLYVTANPKPMELSYGLQVGEYFINEYKKVNPNDTVETFDIYNENVPLIDGTVLSAWGKLAAQAELTEEEAKAVGRMNEILEQFLSADKVVFATPMWNLSFPPMLKAYIDNLVIAGKTFKYNEQGQPVGLVENKKVLHIFSSGGVYSEGPAQSWDFTNPFLQSILAFIGITDYSVVRVEGMNAFADKVDEIVAASKQKVEEVAKTF
ncbi:FMN-dependent NADH-azoreductase [Massilibacterium senegalense]|uniref:FMN-dependent NADH-azoreductase n=1 Tax=Massilibacterium senegalense TaxID=1632858 RepID=UPI0007846B08|nr:FMN-dependent NADH-azoreductase [Massilibacterium senegalense]